MNPSELVRSWPKLAALSPTEIIHSPAWHYPVDVDGRPAALKRLPDVLTDELYLSIEIDGVAHVLGLSDTAACDDLHLLWARRAALPQTVVLALVEKECGQLLQLLENLARAEVRLTGLVDRPTMMAREAFALDCAKATYSFSLDLPEALVKEFGRFDCLDAAHESIRSLTRPVRPCYAAIEISRDEVAALKSGDFLVLEDMRTEWLTELPKDDRLYLVGGDETSVTFANMADGAMPTLPEMTASSLVLSFRGNLLFPVSLTKVGEALAIQLLKRS